MPVPTTIQLRQRQDLFFDDEGQDPFAGDMAFEFERPEFVGGEFNNRFLARGCHIATQVVAVQMKLVVGIGVEDRDSHGPPLGHLKGNGGTRGLTDDHIDLHDFIDRASFGIGFSGLAIIFVLQVRRVVDFGRRV